MRSQDPVHRDLLEYANIAAANYGDAVFVSWFLR